jgi:hypothetical protein
MTKALIFLLIAFAEFVQPNQNNMTKETTNEPTTWILSELRDKMKGNIKTIGHPEVTKCKYGEALTFNGISDGLLLQNMPLKGLDEFTVEVIFEPQSGGGFEQRYLHFGEVLGDRVLLELRATPTHWYADSFIKVGEENVTLISPELLHPLDKWYHLAYVNEKGKFTVYIDGKKELEGVKKLPSLKGGSTSLGMRQNEVSWFRGAIYEVKITPKALKTEEFLKL